MLRCERLRECWSRTDELYRKKCLPEDSIYEALYIIHNWFTRSFWLPITYFTCIKIICQPTRTNLDRTQLGNCPWFPCFRCFFSNEYGLEKRHHVLFYPKLSLQFSGPFHFKYNLILISNIRVILSCRYCLLNFSCVFCL